MKLAPIIARVDNGLVLSEEEAHDMFAAMFAGRCSEHEIAGLLTALHSRGETVHEILAAVRAARECQAQSFAAPAGAIDTCGTGGDGSNTFNISTAAALAAAASGLMVVKHGNRAQTSRSGSADVLEALGFSLAADPAQALASTRFAFLFAPQFHPGFKQVAAVRKQLAHRTIFNLLGPLLNPAQVKRQVIGVFDAQWVAPMGEVVLRLGHERAVIVHGGGTDEFSLWGEQVFAVVENGKIQMHELSADHMAPDNGEPWQRAAIAGGDARMNATMIRAVLGGLASATATEIVALNLAAAGWVAGGHGGVLDGLDAARAFLRSGAAGAWLASATA